MSLKYILELIFFLLVDVHPHSPFLLVWAGKDTFLIIKTNSAKTERVLACFNRVYESEVGEVVHIDALLQDDDHLVSSKLYGVDVLLERQLSNALLLMIIPEHHFICWVFRMRTASHKRKNITSEQHLYNPNASIEFSLECVFVRTRIVDSKSSPCSASKAL